MTSRTADYTGVLKRALHDALDGVTVDGETVRHYERVRSNAGMPYFQNGPIRMTDTDAVPGGGYKGSQVFEVQMNAFSDYRGDKQVDALRNKAITIMMDTLTVEDGFKIVRRSLSNSFTVEEEDAEIRHGIVEVTLTVQILIS